MGSLSSLALFVVTALSMIESLSASVTLPTKLSTRKILKEVEAWETARKEAPQTSFWDVYQDESPWSHRPIPGVTAEPSATAQSGTRVKRFWGLRQLINWRMAAERTKRTDQVPWKVSLRGDAQQVPDEGGVGRGGKVFISSLIRGEGQKKGSEDATLDVSRDVEKMDIGSPMRMQGGGDKASFEEAWGWRAPSGNLMRLMRLKGGMRLFTHNIISSPASGMENPYPLGIEEAKSEIVPSTFDPAMVKSLLPKVDWPALLGAVQSIGGIDAVGLVEELPRTKAAAVQRCAADDEAMLRALYRVLVEVRVMEGFLVCPSTGRRFSIYNGVPNLLSAPVDTSGRS